MADLSIDFAGIRSPNPFWLASGPPTNSAYQAHRAFEAGWGGVVWKTIGAPIVNVNSRYGALGYQGKRVMGFNNIELITDRPIEDNLREIREVKERWPDRAVIASLMVESSREAWHDIIRRVHDTGADGIELNFGCPHGMSERGMGAAVGQVPEYTCRITEWVMEAARIPVIVKLTPNVADIVPPGLAAQKGGAGAVSLINTINSVTGVDLDSLVPNPNVHGRSSHGGYCGPAVKPIALNMVGSLSHHPEFRLPISGIGGIEGWSDAAEFIAMGALSVQVCTAAMKYGFRIVTDMITGLSNWMDEKGFRKVTDFCGLAAGKLSDWGDLDLNYRIMAHIDEERCVGCQICYIACEDGAHQAILLPANGKRVPRINEEACVGCNLCSLVCPVDGCITMVQKDEGKPVRSFKEYVAAGEAPRGNYPMH
ncbi:MAG: NAD-dependent dihydropyrimidine dehydrogenase subunit PreA [Armatimonadetes bacterium]|nr:NAD-dependent dihydropyrimidine dehydrogenase subunit PreA [Armatimonadota bacterium]